jgi:hypothetical protein
MESGKCKRETRKRGERKRRRRIITGRKKGWE